MKPITLLLSAISLSSALAGEHTVKAESFETSVSVDVTFLPTKTTVLSIAPEEWSTYTITDLVEQGASVKKDDILIACDRDSYDRHLIETKKGAESRKIALANALRELADLELSTPRDLEGARLTFERAKEALDYFTTTGRELEVETAEQRLESARLSLSYYEEELKQLLKMYEEDAVTEETEEIILKRQRAAVKNARFSLKKTEESTAWTLDKTIPRKAVDLQRSFDSALLAYETAKESLPRTLAQKKLSVEKAIREDKEADRKQALLEKDAAFFTLTSPGDGVIYYGEIAEGKWSLGNTSKFLFENGSLPKEAPLMTFVPAVSSLALTGFVGQDQRLELAAGNTATISVAGLPNREFAAKVESLATFPDVGGKYRIDLSVTLPDDVSLVGGMAGKAEVITYLNEEALTVPKAAITKKNGKSWVKVKLTDGKDEEREVTPGRTSGETTEILSGLAIDQVVLTP